MPNDVIRHLGPPYSHQMADGKWAKVYAFADGSAQLHAEPDGNFEAWEKKHLPELQGPGR